MHRPQTAAGHAAGRAAWAFMRLATGLATAILALPAHAQQSGLYAGDASAADARFGSLLGAGSQWQSGLPAAPGPAAVSFGGGLRLSCTGIDFNGFLHAFDPKELISELRDTLLTGAQAAASNYLITLAYASPTVSSVLDMMDQRYSARFGAFAQACNAQEDRARGQDLGAKAMAAAGDQCFGQQIAQGTAPTEAYRRCSVQHTFDNLDIPAAANLGDFLRKYTSINVTKDIEVLLGLLPDTRLDGGNFQFRPPLTTIAGLSDRLRVQARAALDRIEAGVLPSAIPNCSADVLAGRSSNTDGCLPSGAQALVASSAFQGAHLLGAPARALFKDALSAQIALSEIYSRVTDLYEQTARIDVRGDAAADAAHTSARRQQLLANIGELLTQVDTQVKAQEVRARIVRSQMLALEQLQGALDARARTAAQEPQSTRFSLRDLVRLFGNQAE